MSGRMSEEGGKLTLRRLEGPINKFTKVALPTDLERLQRHHSNILKVTHTYTHTHIYTGKLTSPSIGSYRRTTHREAATELVIVLQFQHSGQWDRLHQEHINASRTVQVKHRHTHTGLVLSIYSML